MTTRSATDPGKARARAEACFAVARSATFAGERDNAISRGTAIAAKAGLDLDGFDIPGRVRARRSEPAPNVFTIRVAQEAVDRLNRHMEAARRAGEAARAVREALARAEVDHRRAMADEAAVELRLQGYHVEAAEDDGFRRLWIVTAPTGDAFADADDDTLVRIAISSGSMRHDIAVEVAAMRARWAAAQ